MDIQYNSGFNSPINHFRSEIYNSGYAKLDTTWNGFDIAGSMSRLYFILSGSGKLIYGSQTFTIRPDVAFFIPAGVTWNWITETDIEKFFIDFNLYKPNGENLFIGFPSILELPCPAEKTQQMIDWYLSDKTEDWFFLKSRIYDTFSEILRLSELETATVSYHPVIMDTLRYIQKNLSLNLTLQTLAERSFVSKTFLSSLFKKEIGMPIGKYIDRQVLTCTCLDLEQQRLSIAEISNKYGFCDQFYFSRFFKKHQGESPSQYRTRCRSLYYNRSLEHRSSN